MDRFYFIPKLDRRNADKENALTNLIEEDAPYIGADGVKQYPGLPYGTRILTAFGEIPDVITAKWCQEFVSKAEDMTGEKVEHVKIVVNKNKKAHYWVKANCLRLYDAGGCYYENNNGVICRDRVAIADSI